MKRGTPRHPKVDALMELANVSRAMAVGWLELLWHATAEFAPRGDIGKCSDSWIEAQLDWRGKRGRLIDLLVRARLLDESKQYRLVVHDWRDHADESTKRKLQRAGQWFVEVTGEVTEKKPTSDGQLPFCESDGDSQPSLALPCLAIARPSQAAPDQPHGDSEDPVRPPPDTPTETAPAVAQIREMLVEFTRGRLGSPDDRVCLKLLNFAGGEPGRIESWLVAKATRRDQAKSWGWFIQAGEAELREARILPIRPKPKPPADNVFDPARDLGEIITQLAEAKTL
jgi:hypothetical protein